ncbi:MAG: metallophosphoesterase [Velocimicrobium sp.]
MKKKIDVTTYRLEYQNLPVSFDGCRIGFLSDLHNNEIGRNNTYLLQTIKKRQFDYFFCVGDMIIGTDYGSFQYEKTLEFIQKLSEIAPVYYALGNHEERMRQKDLADGTKILYQYKKELLHRNVIVLDGTSIELFKKGQAITLKGLSLGMEFYKKWWKRTPLSKSNIEQQIRQKNGFTIMLAHNPVYFKTYDAYGAELVLSGHVHGGIMILPKLGGIISPELMPFPKYDFGYFEGSNSKMILSRGLGTHTIPIRIHNRPEFIDITLNRTCELDRQLVK